MQKSVLVTFLLFLFSSAHASTLRIGILNNEKIQEARVGILSGGYVLIGDSDVIASINSSQTLRLLADSNEIALYIDGIAVDHYHKIVLRGLTSNDAFFFCPSGLKKCNTYSDCLELTAHSCLLNTVNIVALENYVQGAVEAEAGNANETELLKLQAVICRTYALSHLQRHKDEGFDLCDQVHCQAYQGKVKHNTMIPAAVDSTCGLVIVDTSQKPIDAVFHSNCGGQTIGSDEIWTTPLPYLLSVQDTFCIKCRNASWQKKISLYDWKEYLQKKCDNCLPNNIGSDSSFEYIITQRTPVYEYMQLKIPYKTIRSDWNLRSAYFSVVVQNDSVLLNGRGYGHGVGLCQEGAERMAEMGMKYQDIIRFYYKNVWIVKLK